MKRSTLLVLAGLILIQGFLAWKAFVPAPHSGGDNAGYVALGKSLATGQGYTELWDPAQPAHTKYPPVFPALIALMIQLGVTTWVGLKGISFVAALVVTAGTFLWAERRVGLWSAAGVALLTGASSAVIIHSHWILSDVPFLAFTMLALWGMESAMGQGEPGADGDSGADPAGGTDASTDATSSARAATIMLSFGVAMAFLAYFTRSAGLPLVVAILGAFALRRRFRALAVTSVVVGLPALVWMSRGARAGSNEGRYASEFLLINPYDPGLGTVSAGGMIERIISNTTGYITSHLPIALGGAEGGLIGGLTIVVLILGLTGWVLAMRRGPGPAELFLPMYAGLILIWPEVWSGDRFALPLIPLLFLYSAEGIAALGREKWGALINGAQAAILILLIGPMMISWSRISSDASRCAEAVDAAGPWACAGSPFLAFTIAARWAEANLEPGSAVMTRKPRIFYAMSGLPSRTYPFEDDAQFLFDEMAALNSRYVVLDGIGGQGIRYVGGAVIRNPARFCQVIGFGRQGTQERTEFLGLLPPAAASADPDAVDAEGVTVSTCGPDLAGRGVEIESLNGPEIPILLR